MLRFVALLILASAALLQSPAALARDPVRRVTERGLQPDGLLAPDRERKRQLSPAEAARRAQQQNGGGRVLSVDPADNGYRVKLLKDGNVRVLYISG